MKLGSKRERNAKRLKACKHQCSQHLRRSPRALAALGASAGIVGISHRALAANGTWAAGGASATWTDATNWTGGGVPGISSAGSTTNTDTATFNAAVGAYGTSGTPVVIPANFNVENISFDTAAGNFTIGSTGGNSIAATTVGAIQILSTLTSANALETLNAPISLASGAIYGLFNYSAGGTAARAGTLNFAGAIGAGGSSATLVLGGTNTNANTITGVIGANISLVSAGTGSWILTGANTYTGTTTISGGTLQLGNGTAGSLNGATGTALTFAGTGTFNVDEAPSSNQSMGALTLSGGDDTVQSTLASGSTTLTFTSMSARSTGAVVNLVASGGTTNNIVLSGVAAGFINQGTFFNGSNYAYMNSTGGNVRAISYTSDAGAATTTGGAVLPSHDYTGSGSLLYAQTTGNITAQGNQTVTTLNIVNSANAAQVFTLGSSVTLTANGILESGNGGSSSVTTISGGTAIQAASGAELVIRTDKVNDQLTISTPILANGTNVLTKSGAGTLTLSAATGNYTGGTRIDSGTLAVGNVTTPISVGSPVTSGPVGTGTITLAGGTFATAPSVNLNAILNTVTAAPGSTSTLFANNSNFYLNGSLTGNGTINFGETPNGSAISTSGTTIFQGDLSGFAGTINYNDVVNGQQVSLQNISTNLGNATVVLSGGVSTSTARGVAANVSGTVQIGALSGTGGTLGYVLGGSASDTYQIGALNTSTAFAGSIANNANGAVNSVTKVGTGTLTLTGTSNYTGNTLVSGGTLQIGNGAGGSISNSSAGFVSVGTLAFDEATNSTQSNSISNAGTVTGIEGSGITNTLSGAISGTGNFTQTGAGTTILSGTNSYSGGTTITAGTLLANSGNTTIGSVGSGLVTIAAGGTLGGIGQIRGSITVSGIITAGNATTTGAPGTLTANASGNTTTLAGNGTYDVKINHNSTGGTAGTNWDQLVLSNLAYSGNSSSPFNVTLNSLNSGNATGAISGLTSSSWVIATTTTAPTGLATLNTGTGNTTILATAGTGFGVPTVTSGDSGLFALNTAAFDSSNSITAGNSFFALELINTSGTIYNLDVVYNAAPEPGAALLILGGVTPMLNRRRRKRRNS